jgi:hypothetical protein
MKVCKDCKHFGMMGPAPACSGPHIEPSVISGQSIMMLPSARLGGFGGFREGYVKCGDEEARYWEKADPKPPEYKGAGAFFWFMLSVFFLGMFFGYLFFGRP